MNDYLVDEPQGEWPAPDGRVSEVIPLNAYRDMPQPTSDDTKHAYDVELIQASKLTPAPIKWIWQDWLAAGKLHILGGAPGTGKTTIALSLAGTISAGGKWPDGTLAEGGNVVIWSGEDDAQDTLVPRLDIAGADRSRIHIVGSIHHGDERRPFDPAKDMEGLLRSIERIGNVRLLIIDPIVSAVSGDSHKNAEVRRGLQPLFELANATRCAVLGITHFTKGTGGRDPVERITGSLAFGALARIVMVAAKHQQQNNDGANVRLFCRAKSNIGPDSGGFEYELCQTALEQYPGITASAVQWGQRLDGSARDLLATADATDDESDGSTLADAKSFLRGLLTDGPVPTNTIKKDAEGAGYSWATIRRAQKALGIEAVKTAMKGGWTWSLP